MEDSIGFRIRRARMWRGLSQAELARRIGISATSLNAIEREYTDSPGARIIQRIARVLNVSSDFLLGLSDDLPAVAAEVAAHAAHTISADSPTSASVVELPQL